MINNFLTIITINGKVNMYKLNRNNENILFVQDKILEIFDESADFIDIVSFKEIIMLLDVHRGVIFYNYNETSDEFVLN